MHSVTHSTTRNALTLDTVIALVLGVITLFALIACCGDEHGEAMNEVVSHDELVSEVGSLPAQLEVENEAGERLEVSLERIDEIGGYEADPRELYAPSVYEELELGHEPLAPQAGSGEAHLHTHAFDGAGDHVPGTNDGNRVRFDVLATVRVVSASGEERFKATDVVLAAAYAEGTNDSLRAYAGLTLVGSFAQGEQTGRVYIEAQAESLYGNADASEVRVVMAPAEDYMVSLDGEKLF